MSLCYGMGLLFPIQELMKGITGPCLKRICHVVNQINEIIRYIFHKRIFSMSENLMSFF